MVDERESLFTVMGTNRSRGIMLKSQNCTNRDLTLIVAYIPKVIKPLDT